MVIIIGSSGCVDASNAALHLHRSSTAAMRVGSKAVSSSVRALADGQTC